MGVKIVRDIVIDALTEYVETVGGAYYGGSAERIANAAYDAVADALAVADREAYARLTDVMLVTVEVDDDDEPDEIPQSETDMVVDAVRALVKALGVTL